eukprot:TRINITY_DN47154_c0_g1_i1.p1 TRINITY_DN47154_c0_g1~~TRINITY_DN47154_c0_g1_i1.p1  ORF type:complete len:277 (+),score=109.30 TRINITY_DN47154_c0_g1_i1:68-832(+)
MAQVQYELPPGLEDCAALQELYKELGDVPRDQLLSTRHGFIDHLLGPQKLGMLFNSPPRYRPHEDRLLVENYDPLYCLQGMTRVCGSAWLAGMVVGGVQGFYDGLKRREHSSRSWRSAYQSLWNFSMHQGPRRANTFAAVGFVFCFAESFARHLIRKNEEMLRFKEKGIILGRFGSADEDDLRVWQKDGRYCAPVGAATAAVFLRLLKGGAAAAPPVVATNAVLAAAAAFAVAHLWDDIDYFDLRKKMQADILM